MGIVKRKALETKLVQQYQVSRLKLGAGRVVVGRRVEGVREGAWATRVFVRGDRSGQRADDGRDPKVRASRAG
jgi:hypothetical protein